MCDADMGSCPARYLECVQLHTHKLSAWMGGPNSLKMLEHLVLLQRLAVPGLVNFERDVFVLLEIAAEPNR